MLGLIVSTVANVLTSFNGETVFEAYDKKFNNVTINRPNKIWY